MNEENPNLTRFGFTSEPGSSLTKRTIMTNELFALFESVPNADAGLSVYQEAIVDGNCLGKRTAKNRGYSFTYLKRLYGLSPELIIFRAFRYFFARDENSQGLLCLLTAFSRDRILQQSAGYITNLPTGASIDKEDFENHMNAAFPERFGTLMLQSLVRNLLSSWTQSGHISEGRKRVRQYASPASGAVAFALLLGYLKGARGETLFNTEYMKLLDCTLERALDLAEDASRRGWIVFNRIGDVIEVLFPNLINSQEMEWIRE